MATRIVETGEVVERLSVAQYLALVAQLEFPRGRDYVVQSIAAGDAGARFMVYGGAIRKGLIERVRG